MTDRRIASTSGLGDIVTESLSPLRKGRLARDMGARLLRELVLDLIRPSPGASLAAHILKDIRETENWDWSEFCSLLHWSGLAPLAYRRLRKYALLIPDDAFGWLRVQYYQTIGRNLLLLGELREITQRLTNAGIIVLVFKGPVLAHLCHGLDVRVFGDLDLLVQDGDLIAAEEVLRLLGYEAFEGPAHPFHRRYVRPDGRMPYAVEVHFSLTDPLRAYTPDVAGVWDRSVVIEMFGRPTRMPDLTDHLLLVMMQLPHHRWSPRLLADIGQLMWRWRDSIDWSMLAHRARGWQMRALVGSALAVVTSALGVPLPAEISSLSVPEGYLRRVQWNIVAQTVLEQFVSRTGEISRFASLLIVDQLGDTPWRLARRAFRMAEGYGESRFSSGVRRIMAVTSAFPQLGVILAKSAVGRRTWDLPETSA